MLLLFWLPFFFFSPIILLGPPFLQTLNYISNCIRLYPHSSSIIKHTHIYAYHHFKFVHLHQSSSNETRQFCVRFISFSVVVGAVVVFHTTIFSSMFLIIFIVLCINCKKDQNVKFRLLICRYINKKNIVVLNCRALQYINKNVCARLYCTFTV